MIVSRFVLIQTIMDPYGGAPSPGYPASNQPYYDNPKHPTHQPYYDNPQRPRNYPPRAPASEWSDTKHDYVAYMYSYITTCSI